ELTLAGQPLAWTRIEIIGCGIRYIPKGLELPGRPRKRANHTFVSVSAGHYPTIGLTSDGRAFIWGEGDVSPRGARWYREPWPVAPNHTFVAASAGGRFTVGGRTANRPSRGASAGRDSSATGTARLDGNPLPWRATTLHLPWRRGVPRRGGEGLGADGHRGADRPRRAGAVTDLVPPPHPGNVPARHGAASRDPLAAERPAAG